MTAGQQKKYKGYNGTLILTDTGVTIKRGGITLRGNNTIPYRSITAVQMKKAGLYAGYIQITFPGGQEANGIFQAVRGENAVAFYNWSNKAFEEAKRLIEERMMQAHQQPSQAPQQPVQNTGLDDLEKLAGLKDKGIITQQEFDLKKKQLLGL